MASWSGCRSYRRPTGMSYCVAELLLQRRTHGVVFIDGHAGDANHSRLPFGSGLVAVAAVAPAVCRSVRMRARSRVAARAHGFRHHHLQNQVCAAAQVKSKVDAVRNGLLQCRGLNPLGMPMMPPTNTSRMARIRMVFPVRFLRIWVYRDGMELGVDGSGGALHDLASSSAVVTLAMADLTTSSLMLSGATRI